jgi:hypothetical protein
MKACYTLQPLSNLALAATHPPNARLASHSSMRDQAIE